MCRPKSPQISSTAAAPPPPAPAPAPPAPAAIVKQGSPEMPDSAREEVAFRTNRRGRRALRIDLNVPGRAEAGPNMPRG